MVSPEMVAVAAMAFISGSLIGSTVMMLVFTRDSPDTTRDLNDFGTRTGVPRIPGEKNAIYRTRIQAVSVARERRS